jgi:integrase
VNERRNPHSTRITVSSRLRYVFSYFLNSNHRHRKGLVTDVSGPQRNARPGTLTFRHSFGTILKANGEDVKTVQELLRHANSRITLDVYTQATTTNKRAAQSRVVKMMVPNLGETKGAVHPQNAQ